MGNKLLIGNWKSNQHIKEVSNWFEEFSKTYKAKDSIEVVLAVPFVFLMEAAELIKKYSLVMSLAAEDVSPYEQGSYTGAINASMLSGLVKYSVVGHSERREYFKETNQDVARKVERLLEEKITPVVCVDEPYMGEQLGLLSNEQLEKIVVAYEPLSAIGTGNPANPDDVSQVVKRIKQIAPEAPIIYGGSTNAENTQEYAGVENVSGLLPGGSSLKPVEFSKMVDNLSLI